MSCPAAGGGERGQSAQLCSAPLPLAPPTCTLHQHLSKLPDAPNGSQLQAHVGHILEGGGEGKGKDERGCREETQERGTSKG